MPGVEYIIMPPIPRQGLPVPGSFSPNLHRTAPVFLHLCPCGSLARLRELQGLILHAFFTAKLLASRPMGCGLSLLKRELVLLVSMRCY